MKKRFFKMKRFTRPKDNWECRIKDCHMEDYLINEFDIPTENYNFCENCPFEELVNKLAELEDKFEGDINA